MDYSVQATIHGAGQGSMAKNSLFNAIKDAIALPDLTLVLIDSNETAYLRYGNQVPG